MNLSRAIRVRQWNDTLSIKLWILITQLEGPLAKHTGVRWADIYKIANDILHKIKSDRRVEDSINAFTFPRGQWLDYDGNKPANTVNNAIGALRFLLEDEKKEIRYDVYKGHTVIVNARPSSVTAEVAADIYDAPIENIEDPEITLRTWRNKIHKEYNVMFSFQCLRDAKYQIAVENYIHSVKDYYTQLQWDGKPRVAMLVKEILKAQGTELELEFMRMHLIASVRRIMRPGTKYDYLMCLFGAQGLAKSSAISILYRRHNVLDEDILKLTTKEQGERTRGKNAIEFSDTLGEGVSTNAIKSFLSRSYYEYRKAYGREEDMFPHGITWVPWYTGNDPKILKDTTGNRRYWPIYILGEIDEDLLRQERNQIWAEAVVLEARGRAEYEAEQRARVT